MNRQTSVGLSIVRGFAALLASAAPLFAQQPEAPARPPAQAPINIIADNLNRAAATAAQLLEILNKDAGMMVEFKQLLAREAGINGQILEEADLDEAAVAERLRSDLRARVLATTLLRKYGYLVPRINPDSDLAAEHSLMLRERTQEIERTAERTGTSYSPVAPQNQITCRERSSRACTEGQPPSHVDRQMWEATPPTAPKSGPSLLRTGDLDLPNELQPDALNTPRELAASFTTGAAQIASAPDLEASLQAAGDRQRSDSAGRDLDAFVGRRMPLQNTQQTYEEPIEEISPRPQADSSGAPLPVTSPVRGALTNEARTMDFEAARMRRRPNPYADVPSLYDLYVQAAPSGKKTERFGLDVFQRGAANLNNLPMDLPVGPDYVVGPGDGLSLNLWGGVSERLFRTVDREGRVALPEVGSVLVAGRTLAAAQDEVERALRTQFRHISADVSLLRLRTVRVYVVGEVASPGAYDVSSLSTPLNALFAAGGVTPTGSLRRLEHFRGKQLLEEVDAYDLLLHGIRGDVQRLENGDSLRIPSVERSVTVDGMVRRPATYELRQERNLSEMLELAGGLLPSAALRHIEVQRLLVHQKRTMLSLEVSENSDKEALRTALENFAVWDGDEIHIFPIAPYNSDVVFLEGHVLRPGRYSYREGMKLKDLVASYKDLLPEPADRYAEIIHIAAPDFRPVVESFRLADALEHPESGPAISPLDTVRIFGRYDFEAAPEILVTGEVHAPGRYRTSGQQHLRDALYQAGGLTSDAWLDAGQIFREENGTTHVFSVNLRNALRGDPSDNLVVEPRDRILVHRQPQKVSPATVTIRGEVARPGRYPLTEAMRVSDLLQSAGGVLRSANAASSDLNHYPRTSVENPVESGTQQKIDLVAALRGDEASNLPLHDGDVLTVPQQAHWKDIGATVSISGEVGNPGTYGIQPGERLSSLLRRAGGLLPTAYPQAAELERVTVRERQEQSRQEMIQRLEQESVMVRTSVSTSGTEEAALRQSAIQQKERVLDALRRAPVSGRLVIHLRQGRKDFAGSTDDIELRAGDTLRIPKQPGFVLVVGQVYNSNAITFRAGKSAEWYLSRAGGPTPLANRGAIFILRSNGEVTSSNGRMWSGGALRAGINPGDTIVVPEKPVMGAGNTWKNLVAIAQIAQAGALAAAVAIP